MRPFTVSIFAVVAGLATTAYAAGQSHGPAAPADTRETIVLTAGERAQLLAGMRAYLESIQEIVDDLANNKTAQTAQPARRAGTKMLVDVSPTLAVKVPMGFMTMSLATHQQFDQLADLASKPGSRGEVLALLSTIMANCTTCHASYRAIEGK